MPLVWTKPADAPRSAPSISDADDMFGRDVYYRGEYLVTPSGDYAVVDRMDAVRQSVVGEAMTDPTEHFMVPAYGMGLASLVKKPRTQSLISSQENRVRERLAQNRRVTAVKAVEVETFTTDDGKPATRVTTEVEAGGAQLRLTEEVR